MPDIFVTVWCSGEESNLKTVEAAEVLLCSVPFKRATGLPFR